jgi:hypothetical protein
MVILESNMGGAIPVGWQAVANGSAVPKSR